jgi:cell division protein FtsB
MTMVLMVLVAWQHDRINELRRTQAVADHRHVEQMSFNAKHADELEKLNATVNTLRNQISRTQSRVARLERLAEDSRDALRLTKDSAAASILNNRAVVEFAEDLLARLSWLAHK